MKAKLRIAETARVYEVGGIEIEEDLMFYLISSIKSDKLSAIAYRFYIKNQSVVQLARHFQITESEVQHLLIQFRYIVVRSFQRLVTEGCYELSLSKFIS